MLPLAGLSVLFMAVDRAVRDVVVASSISAGGAIRCVGMHFPGCQQQVTHTMCCHQHSARTNICGGRLTSQDCMKSIYTPNANRTAIPYNHSTCKHVCRAST